MAFADDVRDWTDWDEAAHALGRALGMFHHAEPQHTKHVAWSDNPLGNGLQTALLALVKAGVLDYREEPDFQYRWSDRYPELS